MTFIAVDVVDRLERRRRFTTEQKLSILSEACQPGASLSAVARKHGLVPSQVFKWRRLAQLGVIGIPGASELPSLVASEMVQMGTAETDIASTPAVERPQGLIEIVMGRRCVVRVDRDVDAEALRRVLQVVGSLA